ncbi:MAG: BrnA antitoxin family protein [Xenococcaceae cyanobacterium MO_188.B32]|nr:BrnA antitoxin family protein [Xenococcaceae cyanobacterium MO_188.B32]
MSISPKRLEELKAISEEDIDTSDIPELDENFWSKAQVVIPESKKAISLRVDRDVLEWFQNQGKGYQSLMNSVLRSYMKYQLKQGDRESKNIS